MRREHECAGPVMFLLGYFVALLLVVLTLAITMPGANP